MNLFYGRQDGFLGNSSQSIQLFNRLLDFQQAETSWLLALQHYSHPVLDTIIASMVGSSSKTSPNQPMQSPKKMLYNVQSSNGHPCRGLVVLPPTP